MTGEKKVGRQALGIAVTVFLLVLVIAALAYLNAGDLDRKKELEMKAEFLLVQGEQEYRLSMQDLLDLKPVDFETIMRTSQTGPRPVAFTGVELRKLFEKYKIQLEAGATIVVNSLDGYSSALTGAEVLAKDNVYLAIFMDGEALKPKSEGGFGPYYLVLKNAEFAQRWVKFVEEIVVR